MQVLGATSFYQGSPSSVRKCPFHRTLFPRFGVGSRFRIGGRGHERQSYAPGLLDYEETRCAPPSRPGVTSSRQFA